jgi:hypothetical protein
MSARNRKHTHVHTPTARNLISQSVLCTYTSKTGILRAGL